MKVKLPALSGNYERPTDRQAYKEVSLSINVENLGMSILCALISKTKYRVLRMNLNEMYIRMV